MSVGLYDVDFFKYHQVMFNLELMKMATYFKGKREITMLSPTYSPERYTHFYLRKDFYDGTFPAGLNKYPNLHSGGLAFTGGKYLPLAEEIEICQPDTFLYDRYKNLFFEDVKLHKSVYASLANNIHLRLSLDGKTVWNKFEKQMPNKTANIVFLHDPDLGKIEGAQSAIKYILKKYSREKDGTANLGLKFPLTVSSLEEFQFWSQFTFNSNFFSINIDKVLNDEEFVEMINSISQAKASKITYNIAAGASSKDDFIMNTLPKIYKQVIFCCRNHKQILLNIVDDFPISQRWRDVITLCNLYMSAAVSYGTVPALYVFCKNLKTRDAMYRTSVMCKEDAREIFMYVMENHPELFKLFYECNNVKLINGGLEDVSYRN